LILSKLTVNNFGPYLGRREISFLPSSEDRKGPICLIGALNGSGKTTLLDALLLALYGPRARCSTRGSEAYSEFLRKSINQRVSTAEGAGVALTFEYQTSNGQTTLEVDRSWQDTGKRITEVTTVKRNGEVDPALTETWSEHVESLIPLGISNLFFFDGEQVRTLAINDDTPQSVRDAIRTLLGLEIPAKLQEDLQIIVTRRRKQMMEPIELSDVRQKELIIRGLRDRRQKLVTDLGELQTQLDRAERELEEQNSQFLVQGGELAQRRHQLERDLGELEATRKKIREDLRELAAGPVALTLAPQLLEDTLRRAEAEVAYENGLRTIGLLEDRDSMLLDFLKQHRDTQGVLLDDLHSFLRSDRGSRMKPLEPQPYLFIGSEELDSFCQYTQQVLPDHVNRVSHLLQRLRQIESQIASRAAQIEKGAAPETAEQHLESIHKARDRVEKLRTQRAKLEKEKEDCKDTLRHTEQERDALLRSLTAEREAAHDNSRVIRNAERVQDVLERYQERLLSRKLHDLERLVAERFRHLSRKSRFVDRVEMEADTFSLRLFDDEGNPIDKRRMSAGEQQLLAISFLWALALASGRNLPVVIDTPLSRMDSKHRDKIVDRYFPHASHQVILLSTDVEIDEAYYKRLHTLDAIDKSYRIHFDPATRSSEIEDGYLW